MKKIFIFLTTVFFVGGFFLLYAIKNEAFVLQKNSTETLPPAPEKLVSEMLSPDALSKDPPRDVIDPFSMENSTAEDTISLKEKLTFSNTMEWDPAIKAKISDKFYFNIAWQKSISLPPFPANTSVRTQKERILLKEYKKLRTEKMIERINKEAPDLDGMNFGGYAFGYYTNKEKFPKTRLLLLNALHDSVPIIISIKKEFNRVRPNRLDSDIDAIIAVPGHPAYPSGHSTQAHLIAYILSELIPEKREEFSRDALRIAVHREIAGLHYPSDTAAGAMLARQYLELLKKNSDFASLLNEAKAERKK